MSIFTKVRNSLFGASQPRNPHSLENLKYLYGVLQRNATISDANRDLLTETLRSISEILIWGDQHDSSVFDFLSTCLDKDISLEFARHAIDKLGLRGVIFRMKIDSKKVNLSNPYA
ncbi:unnamed protein product [Rotaria sp. Silwood2]|nr:unnamed protein product [Rotaria sp. Silwood2]